MEDNKELNPCIGCPRYPDCPDAYTDYAPYCAENQPIH